MTLIVGLNLGSYVLLGADTRVVSYPNGQLRFRDDAEKIRFTSAGIITGAGLCDLLDPVKERLANEEIRSTNRIIEIIREKREGLEGWHWLEDDRIREALNKTAWMLTYVNLDNPVNPIQYNLRMAVTIPDEDYSLGLYPPNTARSVWKSRPAH
jgi:hypothetical protein